MIDYRNSKETVDVTFRVYQGRTWNVFVFSKEGIKQLWFVAATGGATRSVKLKCDECNNESCFCPSRFQAFHEVKKKYLIEKEQYEKRRFLSRQNFHLRSVKNYER